MPDMISTMATPTVRSPRSFTWRANPPITPECQLELLTQYFDGNEQAAIDFWCAFAGVTFAVPPRKVIERIVRDKQILRSLHEDLSTKNVVTLSQFHGVPTREINKLFATVTGSNITTARGATAPPLERTGTR